MSNRRASVAWNHFTDIGNFRAVCNTCKKDMSYKSSVSNLQKHIKRKHPTVRVICREEDISVSEPSQTWRDLKSEAKHSHVCDSEKSCEAEPALTTDEEQIITIFSVASANTDPISTASTKTSNDTKPGLTTRKGISTVKYHTPAVAALKEISKRLKERNEIEAERNQILREKNRILQSYLDHTTEQLVVMDDD